MADYKKVMKTAMIVMLVMTGLLMALGPQITKYYQNKYYKKVYEPVTLNPASVKGYPESFRISGVPWFSYKKSYCQSAALQMVAAKNGTSKDLGYFNFLMGFTYGVYYRPDINSPMFFNDPVAGFKTAAPYLGMKMKYMRIDNSATLLDAVRFYVSRGFPVVAEVDAGKIWGESLFIPHCEVVVGYSKDGVEYYETGKADRNGVSLPGMKLSNDSFTAAVASNSKSMMHPWKYSLIIFEPSGEKKDDMKEIFGLIGDSLVGKKYGPMGTGSLALMQFSEALKKKGKPLDMSQLDPAVYTRLDDARFISGYFKGDKDMEKCAGDLRNAGTKYGEVIKLLNTGDKANAEKASVTVAEIAALEKSAGEILISKSGRKK